LNKQKLFKCLLAAAVLTPSVCHADPLFTCPSPEAVGANLRYCSDNVDAANAALECYDRINAAWNSTAAEMNKSLLGNSKRTSTFQQGEMAFSESDLKTSQEKMRRLMETTRYNLDVISRYSRVMLDYVGGESESSSASCYNQNLGRLHTVEGQLKEMIDEAKDAIASTHGMETVVAAYKAHLDEAPTESMGKSQKVRATKAAGSRRIASVASASRTRAPDITGTEQAQEAELLGEFVMKGQLNR
jgi:hypothetical protein